jgi:hypothetical protein
VVFRLDIEIWVIGKGGTEKGSKKRGGQVGEVVLGLLGFVASVDVWVYFCCCSGGCLCQGFQGAGAVYSWYSRLVSRW